MHSVTEVYTLIDAYLEQGKQKSAETLGCVTCQKGCHWCCAEALTVTTMEFEYLFAAIPAAELEGVKERTVAWAKKVHAKPIVMEGPTCSAVDFRKLEAMCPLMKDGQCLVYDRRPYACRAFLATGAPSLCSSPKTRRQQTFLNIPELDLFFLLKLSETHHGESFKIDYLGSFLAHRLLQQTVLTFYTDKST